MRKIILRTFRSRVAVVFGLLVAGNIAACAWAWYAFRGNAVLLGTAIVAFALGLRHAADADHIAAIDNVTRKLMQDGHRPLSVGFYFALGHSTVVLIASLGIFLTATAIGTHLSQFREIGAIFGTLVSALFMVVIALVNLLILTGTYKTFRQVRNGESYTEQSLDLLFAGGGLMTRLFRPVFRMLSTSWHMYPVGFLFGLGFDTATEVALFGISAAAAAKGLSIGSMMIFPVLFAAGMVLVDTTDGILMVGAYGWAFVKPIRKLYYNMTITFVSVVVAFFIGGVEALGLLKDKLNLSGGFWDLIGNLNDNFGSLGFIIIGVFVISWAASMIVYRLMRYDQTRNVNEDDFQRTRCLTVGWAFLAFAALLDMLRRIAQERIPTIVLFFTLMSWSLSVSAKDWKVIRFGVDPSYPPFESKAADGSLVGFDIDLGSALCAKLNAKCVWVENDFDGMIPALQARKIDAVLSDMSVTEKRLQQIDFTEKISYSPTRMVAKAGSNLLPTAESLRGKNIGVEQGTIQETYAKIYFEPHGVNVVSYQNQDQVYADLKSGRLDASLQDEVQASIGFLKTPEGVGFEFCGPELQDPKILGDAVAIGLRKGDSDLKNALNRALAELLKDGTYQTIAKKYFDFNIYGD